MRLCLKEDEWYESNSCMQLRQLLHCVRGKQKHCPYGETGWMSVGHWRGEQAEMCALLMLARLAVQR